MYRITRSTDFNRHPFWFKALNGVWSFTYPLGTRIKIDKDDLIRTARKATGLHDLGAEFWDEPLDRLIWSVNHEADLHPLGFYITRQRLINLLCVRLRAEMLFKKYPQILDQEVYPVWVIAGLQRTGTTKIQRLLATDPDNRVVLSWEAINPAPLDERQGEVRRRIRIARTSEYALKIISPGFFAIHPVEHLAPEEDILLLDTTFLSTTPEATMHVPSYAAWLELTDQSPAYAYGARLLKLLQWQRPAKRWVIKSPHHLEFLPLLEKYYGDIHVIWTHRDITSCVPSFLSMVSYSRAIFSASVDPEAVARHWVRKIGYMLEKGLEYRKAKAHENRFTDMLYEELTGDAAAQVIRIYDAKGLSRQGLRDEFIRAEAAIPNGRYGRHHYHYEDFALDRSALEKSAGAYVDFYKKLIS
jgi:hypothetical protein